MKFTRIKLQLARNKNEISCLKDQLRAKTSHATKDTTVSCLEEVVKTIGWSGIDDRETRIRKAQIIDAIPKLQALEDKISLCGRDIQSYIRKKGGITTTRDVMVILRRLAKKHNHHILYERSSKNIKNTPQYLYYLI